MRMDVINKGINRNRTIHAKHLAFNNIITFPYKEVFCSSKKLPFYKFTVFIVGIILNVTQNSVCITTNTVNFFLLDMYHNTVI